MERGFGSVPDGDQSPPMHASATDLARVYQAARDMNVRTVESSLLRAGRDLNINVVPVFAPPEGRRERPIFVQYLNPELLKCYGRDVRHDDNHDGLAWAVQATRLAVLCTDSYLALPASTLFEVPNIGRFLAAISPLLRSGAFRYVAPLPDLEDYRESKIAEYRSDSGNPYVYNSGALRPWRSEIGGVIRKSHTAAYDICTEWHHATQPGGDLAPMVRSLRRAWRGRGSRFTRIIEQMPDRLDGQAFIGPFVRSSFPVPFSRLDALRLDFFLSMVYLRSYLKDFDDLDLDCGLAGDANIPAGRLVSVRALRVIFRMLKVSTFIESLATWHQLLSLRNDPDFALLTLYAFRPVELTPIRVAVSRAIRRHALPLATSYGAALGNVRSIIDYLNRSPIGPELMRDVA